MSHRVPSLHRTKAVDTRVPSPIGKRCPASILIGRTTSLRVRFRSFDAGCPVPHPKPATFDKPVPLANMRSHWRNRVFVCLQQSGVITTPNWTQRFPQRLDLNYLQPRMLCTVCIIAAPSQPLIAWLIAAENEPFDDPMSLPRGRATRSRRRSRNYIPSFQSRAAAQEWQPRSKALLLVRLTLIGPP